jgi:hypothetical protein
MIEKKAAGTANWTTQSETLMQQPAPINAISIAQNAAKTTEYFENRRWFERKRAQAARPDHATKKVTTRIHE